MTRNTNPQPESRKPHSTNDTAGDHFNRLVELMRRLRSPSGCPWDREQTLHSLQSFLLEETYEVLDAIDQNDKAELKNELGDLLFQIVFLAEICSESHSFTISNIITAIANKLIDRHPHVFGEESDLRTPGSELNTTKEITGLWEELKAKEKFEKGHPQSLLGSVPETLPALLKAHEIGSRVATVGFDWPRAESVINKIDEEVTELREAIANDVPISVQEEMGDFLFSIANLSRKLGVDPETALRQANRKFCSRFAQVEHKLQSRGRTIHKSTPEELEALWNEVKKSETED